MIKKINYLIQAFFVYLFFFIGRNFGIKISRNIFASLFFLIGPFFKSKKTMDNKINIFKKNI